MPGLPFNYTVISYVGRRRCHNPSKHCSTNSTHVIVLSSLSLTMASLPLPDHHPSSSEDELLSASPHLPTDPLMGTNDQHIKDDSRPGDGVAFYITLVRSSRHVFHFIRSSLTPYHSLGLGSGGRSHTGPMSQNDPIVTTPI